MPRTAAVLVIGNEILTGKIQDLNVAFIAQELFALGVSLRRVVVCPDEIDVIARDLDALRHAHDVVFTTGGVGPTHDDVTIAGVAAAFGRPVVRDPRMEAMLRAHYKERLGPGHLRMADIPEGAALLSTPEVPWPTVNLENVYIFPGVPELVRLKFPQLRERLRDGAGFVSRALYTTCDEGDIAALLDTVVAAFPDVSLGSYPQWREPRYRTKLTVDGRDAARVEAAVAQLREGIGAEKIVPPPG
jgi:molybdenum cofactor synthesis domain-containing protein